MDIGFRNFDLSVHLSEFDGKKWAGKYGVGFERTEFRLEEIAHLIKKFCWSPIVWENGIRKSNKFWFSDLVALDFDSPFYSLEQAVNDWCDTNHIIGTTSSHQKKKNGVTCDRFRIISIWDEAITNPRCYTPSLKKLMNENRADKADVACVDLARFFFPCTEIISVVTDGQMIESIKIEPEIDQEIFRIQHKKKLHKHGIVSHWATRQLKHGFDKTNNKNTTCYGVAKDLFVAGRRHDEIFALIRNSKTYDGKITEDLAKEIKSCIRSAFNSYCRMGLHND